MNSTFQHRNLPMMLLRARESVMRYFRAELKEHRLTEQQWRVIRVLNESGEMEAGHIAEESCILSPSLSGVLDRMERNGLITRRRDARDYRKVFVSLTDHSQDVVNKIGRRIEVQYQNLEIQMGQDQLLHTYNLLDALIALPGPIETDDNNTTHATLRKRSENAAKSNAPARARRAKQVTEK